VGVAAAAAAAAAAAVATPQRPLRFDGGRVVMLTNSLHIDGNGVPPPGVDHYAGDDVVCR
jgi:hypothetical protein